MNETGGVFSEQVIRPTGLIDPPVEIKPVEDQVDDLVHEAKETARKGYRTLVTTLTKRMAEDLTEYLHEAGLKVRYMHSDVETLERIELIRDLRLGVYDVLVGINLLREGLDIPECGLVAILDADKEGFLRSETSLIQTIGRAARNIDGPGDPLCRPRSPARWSARSTRPTAGARSRSTITPRTASRPTTIKRNIHDIIADVSQPRRRGRRHRRRGAPAPRRPQPQGLYRRPREAHAQGRRRPRVRGSRPPARRDPPAGGGRARHPPPSSARAASLGHSTEGKPGTRKTRYGKQKSMRMGRRMR